MKNTDGFDASLFHRGICCNAFDYFGAHKKSNKVMFRVWAPNADKVYLVGDFNSWSESHPMTKITDKGIWECSTDYFTLRDRPMYKYKIISGDNAIYKADPYGRHMECPPGTATVFSESETSFDWTDSRWLLSRKSISSLSESSIPLNFYEVHLGSFMRRHDGSFMNYREIAPILASYVKRMGFTHVQLTPLSEFPDESSLGYTSCGLYSPTSRYGNSDDFKYFVNTMHNCGVGIILDWASSSFAPDEHGLSNFDGKPLYERNTYEKTSDSHSAMVRFNISKNEIQSFLLSNAFYYIREFHVDGLKVSGLTSMLFLDHHKKKGEWTPNIHGGNICFEAVAFLKQLNRTIKQTYPDVLMIADETSGYKNVTTTKNGGLGFDLKISSTLSSDSLKSITDTSSVGDVQFKKLYSGISCDNDIFSLDHSEFIYPNQSLLSKMPGEYNMKFAAHRAYITHMMCTPSKKSTFMSCEFGQFASWNYQSSVEWFMLDYDMHNKLHRFTSDINTLYITHKQLWQLDNDKKGYTPLSHTASSERIAAYKRADKSGNELIVVISFSGVSTTVTLDMEEGEYKSLLSSSSTVYGGTKNYQNIFWQTKNSKLQFDLAPYESIILEKVNN